MEAFKSSWINTPRKTNTIVEVMNNAPDSVRETPTFAIIQQDLRFLPR